MIDIIGYILTLAFIGYLIYLAVKNFEDKTTPRG